MNLSEMFSSEVVTAAPHETTRVVAGKMQQENVGAVVIVDGKKVVGIVTDRDLALTLALGDTQLDTPVERWMTRDVITIWDDQGVFNATQYLLGHKVRRLPIIDRNDELVGMVTVDDLFALLAHETANIAKAVEPVLGVKAF